MKLSEILYAINRVLKLSRKPDFDEFKLSLRVCFLGLIIVGTFGFLIQIMATLMLGLGG
ncbi:MAG: protein translocase SEC61 complex subunit gamma [Candidatus Methanomethyliaceae archaeon]|nr:protein translocase SEC61 complex subunit gamma [Candidatus Methanomethyliaceae archaeon]MDW7970672.1 protein translocase SEC61 complex subunit gamma [Nitrososphaerota archaeon]